MERFIQILNSLNAKERNAVINRAFGDKVETLNKTFVDDLSNTIAINPDYESYWAIDFHLDWIAAALTLYDTKKNENITFPRKCTMEFTQEDVDMLVVSRDGDHINLVFIEAKYSLANDNLQLVRKYERLNTISKTCISNNKFKTHYIYLSPKELTPNSLTKYPNLHNWKWMPLVKSEHVTVSRCTEDRNKNIHGEFWSTFER